MAKVLYDGDATMRMIARISHEIIERNENPCDIVLIGILRRGACIAKRICEKIQSITGVTVPVGTLDITLYRDDISGVEDMPKVSSFKVDFDIRGKTVILVDDVIFTGRTARAAIEAVFDIDRPRCIQLVELVDRGHRELPIRPDYVGKNIPTSLHEIIRLSTDEYDGKWCIELDAKE